MKVSKYDGSSLFIEGVIGSETSLTVKISQKSEKLHFHAPIGALDPLKAIYSYIVFSRIRESSLSDNHHWPELLDFQKTPSVMRRGGKMRFPNAMVNINYGLES